MKSFSVLYGILLAALVVLSGAGCSKPADMPTKADVDTVIKESRLSEVNDFTVDQLEFSGKDKLGRCIVGLWGHAMDKERDMNIYIVVLFNKDGQPPAWHGTLSYMGQVTEPATGKDRKPFYNKTYKNWEKAKQDFVKQ